MLVRTPLRILLALGAFFVAATVLAACGSEDNSVPGNAVASIDGTPITLAEYQKWAGITARSTGQPGQDVTVPDPPDFTRCVAELRTKASARRGPRPSDVTLRTQCRQLNDGLVQQTMGTLIQQVWIEKEAADQGVTLSDAELRRQVADTKRQSFPSERDFQRFLRTSGMSMADIEERIRVQALATKLTRKVQSGTAPVTEADIRSYFDRNRSQFAVPERRDVELILTRTEAQADEAKSAVESGTSWAAAARQFSIDDASKAAGGRLNGVSEGQQDRAFDQAAFGARRGEVVGPVRGQFGWYLLRVTSVTPPRQSSLAESRAQIRAMIEQQGQQEKLTSFVRDFQDRWRNATQCREGWIVPLCANAPTPRTTSTAGGTVAPSSGGTTTDAR